METKQTTIKAIEKEKVRRELPGTGKAESKIGVEVVGENVLITVPKKHLAKLLLAGLI